MNCLSPNEVSSLLATAATPARVYLVGAGGCGMSGLGHLLLDLGHRVAGSDLVINEEARQLRARGAIIHEGHAAENLRVAKPIFVVYSSAVRRDNPELQAAEELKIPIVRRATLLAALLARQRGICMAGMHGKTTTTALLAFALDQLGAAPSYAVGWLVPQLVPHARFSLPSTLNSSSSQPYFVIEADESDGTLREFHPEHAIVLNVDAEHLDYYVNLDAICQEFARFGQQTSGNLIFCADDSRLAELFAKHPRAISYGFHPLSAYRIELASPQPAQFKTQNSEFKTAFTVWHRGEKLGDFATALLGVQNVANATAVIALLHQLGYAPADIARAIAPFRGAARRQQLLFGDDRFRVFDDYGHHPAEIKVTLAAFKSLGARRLLVAFQPHRYTRTQLLLAEFAAAFAGIDQLWLADIYAASEPPIPGVTSELLAEAIRAAGQAIEYIPDLEKLRAAIRIAMQPGDLVLFLGAGADITTVAHKLAEELAAESRRAGAVTTMHENLFAELEKLLPKETILRRNELLAKRTTLRVGGAADIYVEPASETELADVLKFCRARALPFVMLGRGSNLLIRDGGIRGVVICLAHPFFSRIETTGQQLRCGAGAPLKIVANEAKRAGLTGLEFLEGIPGSVGGALRMNAGAMGGWMFDVVESIRFMDFAGNVHEQPASEVNVEYRGCPLFKTHIALGAVLKGEPASREQIEQRMTASNEKRWTSQPRKPSAGCIFKNPKTIPAGKLIDELGLKGTRVGGAVVSDIHGNFIVNEGTATARDVLALIDIVKQRAKAARGIELETEVEILGEQ
ncbi:MAG: UDP-N-acetylmuramate--L-alanine ligase [Verrucomicrobia bacterium]|nr:UDP-N-acetylmuramate--L-alanine ligase [Verrucomicrobiota bacterium]